MHFINTQYEYALCLDVEDAELQLQVDIATFASQCEKTYAKRVADAYMTEFESLRDSSVGTANTMDEKGRYRIPHNHTGF